MVSLRASRSFALRLSSLFALSLAAPALGGCSLMHHGAAAGDGGAGDGAAAVAVVDAGAPPPATPANVNEVGRFPDEVSLNDAPAKILDPNIPARNAVPGGALVATLRLGTAVTQVAKHESFILCVFPDPKNPGRNLEGWVAEQAFVAGPAVPSKGSCPPGQTRLVFDEQDFCGKICKSDGDCHGGQVCAGKGNLLPSGKGDAGPGAEVTTCTVPARGGGDGGGAAASAGPRILAGVQVEPLAGNTCPEKFLLAPDKLCHRECAKAGDGPCPHGSKCAHAPGLSVCEAD